jgi:H-type small acid-soluble spore protein
VEAERANYIINSPLNVKVTHRDKAVWLEQVEGSFAHIHYLDSREHVRVPLKDLMEDEPAL